MGYEMTEQPKTTLRIIRRPEVRARTGLPDSSLYERISAGTFPLPVRLGAGMRAVGWVESEVDAWIAEQIANRHLA